MPKVLSKSQVERFHAEGYLYPIRVMSADEALRLRRKLERYAREHGPLAGARRLYKTYLLFTWLAGLVRHSGSWITT